MKRWMKWALLAVLVSVPAVGYAVTRTHHDACPPSHECPCHHRGATTASR